MFNQSLRQRTQPPCRECESRTATCHTWCPAWQRYETIHRAELAERARTVEEKNNVIEYKNMIRRRLS